ncbi:hypothetical protein XENOCAPTIV_002017 [Xenoophorus captivus]|uniref:Kelch domain-containing protein 10 n=1 Tax=Xenoophorus captivus TaxID=1517983 RepID=A0ABV0Q530_9TELE
MSSLEPGGTFSQLNKFEKLSWRPSIRDSEVLLSLTFVFLGSKKRARWLQARRIFTPNGPNLRIPNRFLREGSSGGFILLQPPGSRSAQRATCPQSWRLCRVRADVTQARVKPWLCLSAVLHGNNLLVFGGTGIPFGENNSNDIHVCNVQYRRWNLLNCKGKKPNKIYGQVSFLSSSVCCVLPFFFAKDSSGVLLFQAMVIINGYLYVFGGTTGYLYSTDLHRLDLSTREWTHLKPKNVPSDLPEERSVCSEGL